MTTLIVVIFAVMLLVGAALVLNQVSAWFYSAWGACTRWVMRRKR